MTGLEGAASMNIILVSTKLARARTITVGLPELAIVTALLAIGIIASVSALNYAILRYAADANVPLVSAILRSVSAAPSERRDSYMRDNLNALATRLGQMQAQLVRLESVGERLAEIAGFPPQELMFGEVPGRGGAHPAKAKDLSLGDLTRQLDQLAAQVEMTGDQLGVLESVLTQDNARKKLLPTRAPVGNAWQSSGYGWRIDPFSGQHVFHEGVDFLATAGSDVRAAAGGVVVYSDLHPQYGNMVEIDHGNGLASRYAHAHKRLVNVGDVIMSGGKIAEVGRTGRATGTHLHFEVRQLGVPQDPMNFLRSPR
jgi:murein DD-endopeptidase MepM/ murein hydrolase activator NlpD